MRPHSMATLRTPMAAMHCCGDDEHAIGEAPRDAAARAPEDVGGGETVARGIEDDGDMHEDQRHHESGRRALEDVQPNVHGCPTIRYSACFCCHPGQAWADVSMFLAERMFPRASRDPA